MSESVPSSTSRQRVRVYRPSSEERPHTAARTAPGEQEQQHSAEPSRGPGLSRSALVGLVVALVAAVFAGALGASSVLMQDSSYRSTTVVEIRRNDLFLDVNPGTISVLNALRSKYAALIATEPVVGAASEATGLTREQIRQGVGASITSDSLLFYPFATAASPERSQEIAQAATEALILYAEEEQSAAGVEAEGRIQLRIVQGAGPGSEIGPEARRAIWVALASAAIVGAVVYGLVNVLWIGRRNWMPAGASSDP